MMTMKSHKFDPLSFIAGLVITAVGLAFLIPAVPSDIFDALDTIGAWFWPAVLIVVGVAILAPLASRATSNETGAEDEDL